MEPLPDVLSWFDSRKRATARKLADAMAQGPTATLARMQAERRDDTSERNDVTKTLVKRGDWEALAGQSAGDTVDPGPAGKAIIGGVVGASRLGKPFLKDAQMALENGASADSVWKRSGWEQHPQTGEMNFEIPDNKATLTPRALEGFNSGKRVVGTAQNAIDHPELWRAYPELGAHRVEIQKGTEASGEYYGPDPAAGFEPGGPPDKGLIRITARTPEEARQVLLHELQHGTQESEGFAFRGSSTEEQARKLDALARLGQGPKLEPNARDSKAFAAYMTEPGELQATAVENRRNAPNEALAQQRPSVTMDKILEYLKSTLPGLK